MATEAFAAYLREHLDTAGVTPEALTARVGVGQITVDDWLAGRRVPRPVTADKISTALQLDNAATRRAAGHPAQSAPDYLSALTFDPRSRFHPLRQFLQAQLDLRGWRQADLARRSGLSTTVLSRILKDGRPHLRRLPDASTLDALAAGLGMPIEVVRTAAARSLVDHAGDGEPVTIELTDSSVDELLAEIRRRLTTAPAPADATVPLTAVERLHATIAEARELLSDFPGDTATHTHLAAAIAELETAVYAASRQLAP
ncbi:helix-turn-helix domain-containing protein [Tsukamurella hominis]|uniref:helix-turn-helix domain-containing protein n=1 Tax=Tsukamurella hominis TaxID=1970232 RepID=UPI0039E79C3E